MSPTGQPVTTAGTGANSATQSGPFSSTPPPLAAPPAPNDLDRQTTRLIRQTLKADPDLAAASKNLKFKVDRGIVTLRGTVSTQSQRELLLQKLGMLPGVDRLDDQLVVGQLGSLPQ